MAEKKAPKFKTSARIRILIALVTVIAIVLMFPKGESLESEVSEGAVWTHDDLIAPFSFPILKDPKIYQAELETAANSVYPVFVKEENGYEKILDSLQSYNRFLVKEIDKDLSNDSLQNVNPTFLSTESFNKFLSLRKQERSLSQNLRLTLTSLTNNIKEIFKDVYKTGVISSDGAAIERDSIAIREGNVDHIEFASYG